MSIPKKIHYCWLGAGKMSKDIVSSIESWKKIMPDYEIILWDENKFDINSVPWVVEAYSKKKWSLATDYIRLYAIYTEGGIYLDTDVYVLRRFDDFLQYDYFTSIEYENSTNIFKDVINSDLDNIQRVGNITFQSGLFGGIRGHPFLLDCMEWFKNHHYIQPDGTLYEKIIAPDIYAAIAQKYGFHYISKAQKLASNMMILPSSTFAQGNFDFTEESYAIHWWKGSWHTENQKTFVSMLKQNNLLRRLFGKEMKSSVEEKIQKQKTKLNNKTNSSSD